MAIIERPPSPTTPPQEPLPLPKPLRDAYAWLDERLGIDAVIKPILVHPVPKSVNWFYVLGSATLTAFLFQVFTGVFLAMVYVPGGDEAYKSLQWIDHHMFLGHLLRALHLWGAYAMFILIFAHVARVFLTGAYKYPRELNWVLGVFLLFATILMGFTGQLLVFNVDSYWATIIGTEMTARTPVIGGFLAALWTVGQTITAQTVTHMFAYHVFILPGLMFLLIGGHLYLVVYQGISEWPVPSDIVDPKTYKEKYHRILETDSVPFFPDAMWKDAVFAAIVVGVVLLLAIVVGPDPLGKPPNPTILSTEPKPFWYLIWFYALLSLIPAGSEDYLILLIPFFVFMWMLLLPFFFNSGERSPTKRPWAVGSVGLAVLATAILCYMGYTSPWAPVYNAAGTLYQVPKAITQRLHGAALRGAILFHDEACIACHAVGGVGGQRGPQLDDVSYRLPAWRIYQQIATGGPQGAHPTSYQYMPAFGRTLNVTQISDLVAFLEALPSAEKGVPFQAKAPSFKGTTSVPSSSGAPAPHQANGFAAPTLKHHTIGRHSAGTSKR
jgi:ubiquinol-cytochrome c reductase cytochrome b subunit